jgi:hypothetical protein
MLQEMCCFGAASLVTPHTQPHYICDRHGNLSATFIGFWSILSLSKICYEELIMGCDLCCNLKVQYAVVKKWPLQGLWKANLSFLSKSECAVSFQIRKFCKKPSVREYSFDLLYLQ